jgi:NAD(P)-dependent dehydrogenase (short-subunit alcohol dehydrogenase family)
MKNIIITGATGSIGKASAIALARKENVQLIIAGRNPAKLKQLKQELQSINKNCEPDLIELDLGNANSIKKAAEGIKQKYPKIDALVNIAAIYKQKRETNSAGNEMMFATNHLGPFLFTKLLLDNIKNTNGSKVLTVSAPSSTAIDFENLNGEKKFSAFNAFGASKMMNLLFAFKLGREFEKGSQASMAFHPGLVKSDLLHEGPGLMKGFFRMISSPPEKTAAAIASLITEGEAASQNGKFFDKNMKVLKAASRAYDQGVQDKLWKRSVELTS